jgi:hypothetical protein
MTTLLIPPHLMFGADLGSNRAASTIRALSGRLTQA